MVKSNALDSMLEVLNSSHILKSWSIYNDRYNGDVVVRVRFMQSAECGEAGSVDHGTFKRKTPHQAARDQARADQYKQTRNAKLNRDITDTDTKMTPNIGKTSLRSYPLTDTEVNRDNRDSSPPNLISPMYIPTRTPYPVSTPVRPPSPVSSPVRPPSPVSSPVRPPSPVSSPVRPPSPVSSPVVRSPSPVSSPGRPPSHVSSPVHPPSPIDEFELARLKLHESCKELRLTMANMRAIPSSPD